MKILFRKAKCGGFIDRLIAAWTGGPYCHTEIILNDNEDVLFSSDSSDAGVRYINFGESRLSQYEIFNLPEVDQTKLEEVKIWANTQLGKSYDWMGVFGFVLPWLHDDPNDWFCSEICAEILIRLGLLPELITSKITPNGLAKIVTTKFKNLTATNTILQT